MCWRGVSVGDWVSGDVHCTSSHLVHVRTSSGDRWPCARFRTAGGAMAGMRGTSGGCSADSHAGFVSGSGRGVVPRPGRSVGGRGAGRWMNAVVGWLVPLPPRLAKPGRRASPGLAPGIWASGRVRPQQGAPGHAFRVSSQRSRVASRAGAGPRAHEQSCRCTTPGTRCNTHHLTPSP